jgi:uncharacterized protein involved in outer membrane biogenesis
MKKILLISLAVVAVGMVAALVIVTLSLGSIVKKGVETVGPQITKTQMKLDGATISVFSGSGSLSGFLLGNPEGYKSDSAVKVGEVALGVEPRSVFGDKVHVTHVRVVGAEITYEGALGGQNNLNKILENVNAATGGTNAAKPKASPEDKGASKKLQVDEFLISGAKVKVNITSLGGKNLTVTLPEIRLSNLGSGPEGITAAELTQRVLSQVNASTLEAVQKAVADLSKTANEALKKTTQKANEDLDKANKSLGDLLHKK